MGSEDGGDGDGGEQTNTRFPFLATVRTVVATVVTVLAVVVVLMVIIAVNRPEKIVLYVDYGYIQAEQMWWNETQVTKPTKAQTAAVTGRRPCPIFGDSPGYAVGVGGRGGGGVTADLDPYGTIVDNCQDGRSDDDSSIGGTITTTVFEPVDKVEVSFAVTAYNPSGRGKMIRCNVTTVRVLDVNDSYTGVAIGSMEERLVFHLLPQTTDTKRWTVTITDKDTLHYLNQRYQQRTRFTTMLQVDVAYSTKVGNISFYCSPVTLGYGVPGNKPEETTPCQTGKQMVGYNVTWYPPPHV